MSRCRILRGEHVDSAARRDRDSLSIRGGVHSFYRAVPNERAALRTKESPFEQTALTRPNKTQTQRIIRYKQCFLVERTWLFSA